MPQAPRLLRQQVEQVVIAVSAGHGVALEPGFLDGIAPAGPVALTLALAYAGQSHEAGAPERLAVVLGCCPAYLADDVFASHGHYRSVLGRLTA